MAVCFICMKGVYVGVGKLQCDTWISLVRPRGTKVNWIYQSNLLNLIYSYHLFDAAGSLIRTVGTRESVQESVFLVEVMSRCRALPCYHRLALLLKLNLLFSLFFFLSPLPDIVHENLKMGSDGESDQASGTSSDEVQSPTGVCLRNRGNRRISAEVRFVTLCSQTVCPHTAFLLFKIEDMLWDVSHWLLLTSSDVWICYCNDSWHIYSSGVVPGLVVQHPLLSLKECFD